MSQFDGCPNYRPRVVLNYRKTTGSLAPPYSLNVQLTNPIYNVIGVRVHSVVVTSSGGAFTSQTPYVILTSSRLGSFIGTNPFQTSVTTDNTGMNAIATSSMIGMSEFGLTVNGISWATTDDSCHLNTYMKFQSPVQLTDFDLQVLPMIGTWAPSSDVNVAIVLEFRTSCQCGLFNK